MVSCHLRNGNHVKSTKDLLSVRMVCVTCQERRRALKPVTPATIQDKLYSEEEHLENSEYEPKSRRKLTQ